MIQKLKPDIVITDIRMPFMDGLALSRLIRKEFPWMEIIILSGYEEFAYAREAIQIGISRYLLKPISGDELLKEVDDLSEKIREIRREREIHERYQKEMEENTLQERKNFFQYLVSGDQSLSETLELAGTLNIDISAIWYNIILVKLQAVNHAQEEFSRRLVEAENRVAQIEDKHLLTFDRNLEGKAVLIKADSREELVRVQEQFLEQFRKIVADYSNIRYYAGIGMPVNRLRELKNSFEKASHAFAHRYFHTESCIIDSAQMPQSGYGGREELDIEMIDPKLTNRNRVMEFLRRGDKEETVFFVEEFYNSIGASAIRSNMFRQYLIMDIYFCVMEFVEELQLSREEIGPLDMNLCMSQGVDGAMKYIVNVIQKALELREKVASNRYGDITDEVIRFIEENYTDGDLSLNMVASHVRFSPNHLSMIFSQQTGQTFIRFLTDYRMKKAKELLRCSNKRSSQIALEVGYKDPHYFSYLFKKLQGMTPTQYRNGKTAESEEAEI